MPKPLTPEAAGIEQPDGGEFESVDKGVHFARLVGVAYLGDEETKNFHGEMETKPQIWLRFETPNHKTSDDRPKIIDKKCAYSYFHKSNLAKILGALLGRTFDGDTKEDAEFDTFDALGLCCQIEVVEYIGQKGDTRTKIANYMPLPDGVEVPAQHNEKLEYNVLDHDTDAFERLPNWIKDVARANLGPDQQRAEPPRADGSEGYWGDYVYKGEKLSDLANTERFASVVTDILTDTDTSKELMDKLRGAFTYTDWTLAKVCRVHLEDAGVSPNEIKTVSEKRFQDEVSAKGFITSGDLQQACAKLGSGSSETVEELSKEDDSDEIPF